MSYAKHKLQNMGVANQKWGVCGFTSSFYALHRMRPGERARMIQYGEYKNVVAEIARYLQELKGSDLNLVKDIEDFCQSFEGFESWTVDSYISRATSAINNGTSDEELKKDSMYSIGMPPHAVVDYLKRVWSQDSEIINLHIGGDSGSDGIVGVRNVKSTMTMYDGLCHWVYRRNNMVFSWGKSFGSLTDARADYAPVRLIRLK